MIFISCLVGVYFTDSSMTVGSSHFYFFEILRAIAFSQTKAIALREQPSCSL